MKKLGVLVVCAAGCALLAGCSARPSAPADAAAAAAISAAPTSYATDVNGQTCLTNSISSADYCPGDSPSPEQTDPSGQTCPALDSAGYCPGDDPAPQVTDPSGQSCASLDSAGYCPGDDPAPQVTDPSGQSCASLDSQGYCPGDDPAPAMTVEEQQAVDAAQGYLGVGSGFSYEGLLKQLTSSYGDGFPVADAKFAISYLNPDWDQQAVDAAQGYLGVGSGFSYEGLLKQLTSSDGSGFTYAQAEYAVSHLNPDWDQQAVEAAQGYLQVGGFSRASLLQQLTSSYGSGFTYAQAEYAVNKVMPS